MAKSRKGNDGANRAEHQGAPEPKTRRTRQSSAPRVARASSADRAGLSERGTPAEPDSSRLDQAPRLRKAEWPSAAVPAREPEHAEIAQRAYEIFVRRGGQPGNPMEDWLAAERELKERRH